MAFPCFNVLKVPEEDLALLVSNNEDRVVEGFDKEREAHVEGGSFVRVELEETLEGAAEG